MTLDAREEFVARVLEPQGIPIQKVAGWKQGFELLTAEVRKLGKREKLLLFLDELPWLATPKSGLLQALDYYWNRHWSQMGSLKVVLCGSAASWLLENLIHAKGGLHYRMTLSMRLLPFILAPIPHSADRGIREFPGSHRAPISARLDTQQAQQLAL